MSTTVEKWALIVMLVAGAFLAVAAAIDQEWLRAGLLALATAVVGGVLVRRRAKASSDPTE